MTIDRIVLVLKRSRIEELVAQHLTRGAARFTLESRGQSFERYGHEEATYFSAVDELTRQLPNDLPVVTVWREDLPNALFRDRDLIVVCGPDGLFVNVAKYVGDQPVLTVNPDPASIAGVLMLFSPRAVGAAVAAIRQGRAKIERLPFVKATVDEERIVWAINDVFIGRKDQISARYEIVTPQGRERQSSSGVIVSTAVGSTGWMRSVTAMVAGIVGEDAGAGRLAVPSASELRFVVREPFPSPVTGTSLVTGTVLPGAPLVAVSEMAGGGFVFSDGVIEQAVEWNAGSAVVVSIGERYVRRAVP